MIPGRSNKSIVMLQANRCRIPSRRDISTPCPAASWKDAGLNHVAFPHFSSIYNRLKCYFISIIFLLNRNGIDTIEAGYTIENAYEFSISNLAELEEAYLISLLGDELPDFPEMMNDAENLSGDEIIQYLLAENNIEKKKKKNENH